MELEDKNAGEWEELEKLWKGVKKKLSKKRATRNLKSRFCQELKKKPWKKSKKEAEVSFLAFSRC